MYYKIGKEVPHKITPRGQFAEIARNLPLHGSTRVPSAGDGEVIREHLRRAKKKCTVNRQLTPTGDEYWLVRRTV